MNENVNQRMNEGHCHIVKFLSQWQEEIIRDFIQHNEKQKNLFVNAMDFGLKPAKEIGETLKKDVGKTRPDRSKVKDRLNTSLSRFSKRYNISPPVQLYFKSAEMHKQIVHFACCREEKEGGSSGYVSVDCLHKALLNASASLLSEEGEQKYLYTDCNIIEGQIKECLTKDALLHLREKLKPRDENDYQALDIQHGLIDYQQEYSNPNHDNPGDALLSHGRKWYSFDAFEFLKPFGAYILSSEVGTGKTTFLRYLQWQMLKQKYLLPLFIHANELEKWDPENFYDFAEKYANSFFPELNEPLAIACLKQALHNNSLVLLVDGLDQIQGVGTEYEHIIDTIVKISNKNLIIGSRPTAAISQDNNREFTFLRLEPFSRDAQKQYFDKYYNRACHLAANASELVFVPMLAYMLRTLIEKDQDRNIRNRTDLYKRFINYILKEYKHEKTKLSKDEQVKTLRSLRKISYYALTRKKPFIQKIPLEFCYEELNRLLVRSDDLTKCGFVNLIVERAHGIEDFLYFTHQSFQEYLAAEWATENEDGLKAVFNDMLNPILKEVIRFLAGIKGERFVKEVYLSGGHDAQPHSHLFLAAECCCELMDSQEFKEKLLSELVDLIKMQEFAENAIVAIAKIDIPKAAETLLQLVQIKYGNCTFENSSILQCAIESISAMGGRLTQEQKEKFLKQAATSEYPSLTFFSRALGKMVKDDLINSEDIDRVFEYICSCSYDFICGGIIVLVHELSILIKRSHVLKVLKYAMDSHKDDRLSILCLLDSLSNIGHIANKDLQTPFSLLKDSSLEEKRFILSIIKNTIGKKELVSENVDILLGLLQSEDEDIESYAVNQLKDWFGQHLHIRPYKFSKEQIGKLISIIKGSNRQASIDSVSIYAEICKHYGYNYISDMMNLLTVSEKYLQIIILMAILDIVDQTAANETYRFVKPHVNDIFSLVHIKDRNLIKAVCLLLFFYLKELSSEYPEIASWLNKSGLIITQIKDYKAINEA